MGQLPVWSRGQKRRCDVCGFEYYERDGNLRKQNGIWKCRQDFDSLTEEQRQDSINRRIR
jgi:ribosomal protein L37AE/L43A